MPRMKKSKLLTDSQSAPSQKDAYIITRVNLLLEAFFQKTVYIEKSTLPSASCNESAPLQEHSIEGERSHMEAHTMSGEHITLETPYQLWGSCQKSLLITLL